MSATPWPWTAEQEEPYYLVIKDASGCRIAEVFLDDAFQLYEEPNATARKQADLLAAAPEMLAMLKRISERYLLPVGAGPGPEIAALIAKATGQPPDLHDALESHLASVIKPMSGK